MSGSDADRFHNRQGPLSPISLRPVPLQTDLRLSPIRTHADLASHAGISGASIYDDQYAGASLGSEITGSPRLASARRRML
jgi:hypothetical protein